MANVYHLLKDFIYNMTLRRRYSFCDSPNLILQHSKVNSDGAMNQTLRQDFPLQTNMTTLLPLPVTSI